MDESRWRGAVRALAFHDCEEEEADRGGGSDDGGEDHTDRLDDDSDEVHARAVRSRIPSPQDPHNQTTHKEADPDLPALTAPEVRREGAGDDEEEAERQEEDGHECPGFKRGKSAHVAPSELDSR